MLSLCWAWYKQKSSPSHPMCWHWHSLPSAAQQRELVPAKKIKRRTWKKSC
jgi:hypothetical protein